MRIIFVVKEFDEIVCVGVFDDGLMIDCCGDNKNGGYSLSWFLLWKLSCMVIEEN